MGQKRVAKKETRGKKRGQKEKTRGVKKEGKKKHVGQKKGGQKKNTWSKKSPQHVGVNAFCGVFFYDGVCFCTILLVLGYKKGSKSNSEI